MSGILSRWIGLGLALAAAGMLAAVFLPRVTGDAESQPAETANALPVSVFKVEIQPAYEISRGFTGRVTTRQHADLGFERAGKVASVAVDTGDTVDEGTPLARLDTARLESRRRELVAARAEAQANLTLARKTRARTERLFKGEHVSEQRLDEAVAEVEATEARLERLTAEIASVDVDLEKSTLTAPFAGVIERRLIDAGTVVEAGTPILRLIETQVLEAEIGLPLAFANRLERNDHMPLGTEKGDLVFAEVKSIVPAVRGETRTALVTATITGNVTQNIADGSLVTAELSDRIDSQGFWAPLRALTADVRGLWRVYKVVDVQDGRGKVAFENVQILHSEDDRVFVSGTVNDGDRLIVGGVDRIVPGQTVRIEQAAGQPAREGEG